MGDQKKEAKFLNDFVVTVKKGNNDDDRPKLPELKRLPATIKQITERQLPKSQTVRANFTFVISSGKYKGQYAWGSVPLHEEVTEKADLYKWMCNILGVESISVDDQITIGDLVGKTVEIMIKNTKSNGKIYQNVVEVLTPENDVEEESTVIKDKAEAKAEVKEESKAGPKKETAKKAEPELDVTEDVKEDEISEDDLPF